MGFIQGCRISKSPIELGEVDMNNLKNNMIAKENFETKLKENKEIIIIKNNNISNIITQYNTSADNIEIPPEIIKTKPKNGFQTELLKFNNGDSYQGYYNENNIKDGFGIYIKSNGFIFKGLWKDDKIGEYGLFVDPEGNYFKGNLINGEANGEGELMINNKMKYIGNFNKNLPNKKGKIYNLVDNSEYEGEFVYGLKEGKGIIKYIDGTIYEGDFKNDKYEGYGKLTYKNGCVYEGQFKSNNINGKGKYTYTDGKEYFGDFYMGLKHGFGKLSWNENKYYEGYWINNRQHGEGMFYLYGNILKGIFRYGKMVMKID